MSLSFGCPTNSAPVNSEQIGQPSGDSVRLVALNQPSYDLNLCTTKTCSVSSHLAGHVLHVSAPRCEKQMVWSHTGRVITVVAHIHSVWYRAISHAVGKTVGVLFPARVPETNDAVSLVVPASGPDPTRVGLLDLFQKAFNWVSNCWHVELYHGGSSHAPFMRG